MFSAALASLRLQRMDEQDKYARLKLRNVHGISIIFYVLGVYIDFLIGLGVCPMLLFVHYIMVVEYYVVSAVMLVH